MRQKLFVELPELIPAISELYIFDIWYDNLQSIQSFNREKLKMKHRYQSFTRIGRQFQSLERQVYADWTSVSFPFCQRSCLIWRIMTNTLTNTMTNSFVVIFLSVSIFGRGYHSRYQNFKFTASNWVAWALASANYLTSTIEMARYLHRFPGKHNSLFSCFRGERFISLFLSEKNWNKLAWKWLKRCKLSKCLQGK